MIRRLSVIVAALAFVLASATPAHADRGPWGPCDLPLVKVGCP
jgi:hypothetical protein